MYMGAALMLAATLMPAVQGVFAYSGQAQAVAIADGVGGLLNSLRPGLTTTFGFHSLWGNVTVKLEGHLLDVMYGSTEVVRYCAWRLPTVLLVSDRLYTVRLLDGEIGVKPDVRG
jgi:hypothetical protein